jgi:hypothetical protein
MPICACFILPVQRQVHNHDGKSKSRSAHQRLSASQKPPDTAHSHRASSSNTPDISVHNELEDLSLPDHTTFQLPPTEDSRALSPAGRVGHIPERYYFDRSRSEPSRVKHSQDMPPLAGPLKLLRSRSPELGPESYLQAQAGTFDARNSLSTHLTNFAKAQKGRETFMLSPKHNHDSSTAGQANSLKASAAHFVLLDATAS